MRFSLFLASVVGLSGLVTPPRAFGQTNETAMSEILTLEPNFRVYPYVSLKEYAGNYYFYPSQCSSRLSPVVGFRQKCTRLLQLSGVEGFFLEGRTLGVIKNNSTSWSRLDPQVQRILEIR